MMNKWFSTLMNFPVKMFTIILLTVCTGFIQDKPKILIIGDSISIGYFLYVKDALARKAEVHHNPGNAQHTGTGLEKVEEWIGNKDWDIIQFNWGLWDLCYRHPDSKLYGNRDKERGTLTYTVGEYAANMDSIVTLFKKISDAKLIFVTSTYVPENEGGRYQKDAIRYNEAALKVMQKHAIEVNDIYEKSANIHQKFGIGNDDVHFTEKGYKKLGKLIIQPLKKELKTLKQETKNE